MIRSLKIARGLAALAAVVVIAGACSGTTGSAAPSGGAASYTIGFSNPGGVGNGWREAMICSAKAEAVTTGKVTKVSVRTDCFEGGVDAIPWEQRKPYDEFDYGYVLTVHKSQGSQWDDVVLFDESFAFQDSRARWLYTGITRAAKRLSVVV